MNHISHRVAALVAALALAAGTPPASADPTPSGNAAGGWLARQLTNGLVHNNQYDFDDYGLTIDTALGLAAVGGQDASLQAIRTAMASHVNDYTRPGYGTDVSAGATAKALRLAQVSGADPRSYGGVDLVTQLEGLVGPSGRISDDLDAAEPTATDYANTIGQAYAVEGLTRAGSGKAAAATGFLLAQQCSAGYFRLNFSAASAPDQTCNGTPGAAPDTDVTALAVLALQSRRTDPAVATAITAAGGWLERTQTANGAFGGGPLTGTPNSNSTGLAAAALGATCATQAADRAADWVRSLQVGAAQAGTPLGTQTGAIAYDPPAFQAGLSAGITTGTEDQWRRATSQAAGGLVWDDSAAPTVDVSAARKYRRAGRTVRLDVSGASAGEQVCLTGPGVRRALTGTGAVLSTTVTLGDTTGTSTYAVTTGPGSETVEVRVLGKKKLRVHLDERVAAGERQLVRIAGLAKKEKVRLYVAGQLVAKGKANRKGVFADRFLVKGQPRTVGVKVIGQFANRTGTATFRVVG